MKSGIQTFYAEVGEAACLALCIIQIACRIKRIEFDPNRTLENAIENGLIYYNEKDPNDNNNFFVQDLAKFLSLLTNEVWTCTKESAEYVLKPGEWEIDGWDRTRVGYGTMRHFRLPDWDSLFDSQTVKFGKIATKRIFRKVA